MVLNMQSIEDIYNEMLSWDNLISYGYLDFQEYNDHGSLTMDDIYGHTDVIYPNYFDISEIAKLAFNFSYSTRNNNYQIANTTPILFTIPKNDKTRRPLKFPNLYSYCLLVSQLIAHKDRIIKDLAKDKESTSNFFGRSPYKYENSKNIQNKLLIGHKFYYKTDFSNFFHSFYTHAIAWLIDEKSNAKIDHNDIDKNGNCNWGNLLDHLIRSEQSGETHGVPTGTLATRIIMEECMSYFDQEIKNNLQSNCTGITFHRYVDDIIFGFDHNEQLAAIKKILANITQKYEITLNDKKTKLVTFDEINRNSNLKGFFYDLSQKIEVNKILNSNSISNSSNVILYRLIKQLNSFKPDTIKHTLDKFYIELNTEILAGVKGAAKLGLRSLTFFIKGLNEKSYILLDNDCRYLVLSALIDRDNRIDPNLQSTFIDKILQLVFSDSRLMLPFIQLLDVIQLKEKEIKNNIVTDYLQSNWDKNKFQEQVKFYLTNNLHQEAYATLLLCSKLNFNIITPMFSFIEEYVDKEYVNIDDFNIIFFIHNFILNLDLFSEKDINAFLNMLEKLLKTDKNLYPEQVFTQAHWLIRYYLLFEDSNNIDFHNVIVKFYKTHSQFQTQNMSYDYFIRRYNSSIINSKGKSLPLKKCFLNVNQFYKKLLDNKIQIIKL